MGLQPIDFLVFDDRAWQLVDEASFAEITYDAADQDPTCGTPSDHCPIAVRLELPPADTRGVLALWTGPLIARELGDVSDQYVWQFPRAQRIDLAGRRSWCLSTDPAFPAKAADIIGLYLAPPEHAIVLAVDACQVRAGLGSPLPASPPALGGADHGAVHQLQHRLLTERVGDDFSRRRSSRNNRSRRFVLLSARRRMIGSADA